MGKLKHGLSKTKLYYVYKAMLRRCYCEEDKYFQNYGGRGIKVCKRWLDDIGNFYEDMNASYKPGLTLDRIDNNKGYSKSNCRWATRKQQSRNRTITVLSQKKANQIRFLREKGMQLKEIAALVGVSRHNVEDVVYRDIWKS